MGPSSVLFGTNLLVLLWLLLSNCISTIIKLCLHSGAVVLWSHGAVEPIFISACLSVVIIQVFVCCCCMLFL